MTFEEVEKRYNKCVDKARSIKTTGEPVLVYMIEAQNELLHFIAGRMDLMCKESKKAEVMPIIEDQKSGA
ncbi:MAG: hypothetical protein KAV87_09690 [Desulfobacteraceae bacterium]|nr:hypothetical protein [Desulfobacteraceae bacterium]